MIGFVRRVAPLTIFCAVALAISAFSYNDVKQFGGEIPWPLSVQEVVTVKNSKGLWQLEDKNNTRLFNVEMKDDDRSGWDWIRVSEIDPKTYDVISWGEGFFSPNQKLPPIPNSSFSQINLDILNGKKDSHGRYLSMFPNGDTTKHPYMLRMVEVKTTLGNVLGLSVIEYVEKNYEHMLGTRIMKKPLSCFESEKKQNEELTCYLDL